MNKSPGQIAYEAAFNTPPMRTWGEIHNQDVYEKIATAVLENQWRSVDDPPKDPNERVVVAGGGDYCHVMPFSARGNFRTFWMRVPQVPKPKEPTPLELAQKEFEGAFPFANHDKYKNKVDNNKAGNYIDRDTELLWRGWKVAKEVY